MSHDKKLLGVCGDTARQRHDTGKRVPQLTFRSLTLFGPMSTSFRTQHDGLRKPLGSITCPLRCFTLCRLRARDTHKPLLISNQLIQDYSVPTTGGLTSTTSAPSAAVGLF
ncbi:hypothetical protein C8R44DRAFT_877155 [Mycena epipterygia]|nr:hypothetical protein C8R44DRAFT_877155 [Mycena epipterygia]